MGRPTAELTPVDCPVCGTTVLRYPSEIRHNRRYCSRACAGKGRRADNAARRAALTEKACTRCHKVAPIGDFYTYRGRPQSWCRDCTRAYIRGWQKRNPAKMAEYSLVRNLRRKYAAGAVEEAARLVVRQRGLCAACERPLPKGRGQYLDVDDSDEIRGVLCSNCHMIVGLVHDDPVWLQNLAHYLIRVN